MLCNTCKTKTEWPFVTDTCKQCGGPMQYKGNQYCSECAKREDLCESCGKLFVPDLEAKPEPPKPAAATPISALGTKLPWLGPDARDYQAMQALPLPPKPVADTVLDKVVRKFCKPPSGGDTAFIDAEIRRLEEQRDGLLECETDERSRLIYRLDGLREEKAKAQYGSVNLEFISTLNMPGFHIPRLAVFTPRSLKFGISVSCTSGKAHDCGVYCTHPERGDNSPWVGWQEPKTGWTGADNAIGSRYSLTYWELHEKARAARRKKLIGHAWANVGITATAPSRFPDSIREAIHRARGFKQLYIIMEPKAWFFSVGDEKKRWWEVEGKYTAPFGDPSPGMLLIGTREYAGSVNTYLVAAADVEAAADYFRGSVLKRDVPAVTAEPAKTVPTEAEIAAMTPHERLRALGATMKPPAMEAEMRALEEGRVPFIVRLPQTEAPRPAVPPDESLLDMDREDEQPAEMPLPPEPPTRTMEEEPTKRIEHGTTMALEGIEPVGGPSPSEVPAEEPEEEVREEEVPAEEPEPEEEPEEEDLMEDDSEAGPGGFRIREHVRVNAEGTKAYTCSAEGSEGIVQGFSSKRVIVEFHKVTGTWKGGNATWPIDPKHLEHIRKPGTTVHAPTIEELIAMGVIPAPAVAPPPEPPPPPPTEDELAALGLLHTPAPDPVETVPAPTAMEEPPPAPTEPTPPTEAELAALGTPSGPPVPSEGRTLEPDIAVVEAAVTEALRKAGELPPEPPPPPSEPEPIDPVKERQGLRQLLMKMKPDALTPAVNSEISKRIEAIEQAIGSKEHQLRKLLKEREDDRYGVCFRERKAIFDDIFDLKPAKMTDDDERKALKRIKELEAKTDRQEERLRSILATRMEQRRDPMTPELEKTEAHEEKGMLAILQQLGELRKKPREAGQDEQ